MTDEQIIKAAEICRTGECKGCPYYESHTAGCVTELMKDVFDLIGRQKTEVERLKSRNKFLEIECKNVNNLFEARVQAAIKEFAKFIIDKSQSGMIRTADIPGYVKEMTEVQG